MEKNILSKMIEETQSRDDSQPRDYIGASLIGSDCLRQIWYEYKGFEAQSVPAKMKRTWAIGKHLESLVLKWLNDSGVEAIETQMDLHSIEMPFFKGHLDCIWMKDGKHFAIIEIKTAKDASFNIFVRKGLKLWNPQYYAQIQSYMGMSGIHLAYILVLNKDNSELSDEQVSFDSRVYESLRRKAFMISSAEVEPPRVNGSPLWFKCKMCKFNKICHQ